ncbi:MAG: hypothetical protein M1816_006555 [Peltula sp. TS41687]|nr:MAG: hypothetical protein M1816_006555 [Peltula sp. TS41687]
MDLSKLLSPPESNFNEPFSPSYQQTSPKSLSHHSFLAADHTTSHMVDRRAKEQAMERGRLPSPPVTPADRPIHTVEESHSDCDAMVIDHHAHVRDPVLFSPEREPIIAADQPLFPSENIDPKLDAIVDQHIATHASSFGNSIQPTKDEYLLALSCIPIVSQRYVENPRRWLQQERRILDERFGGANRVGKRPVHTTGLAKIAPAPSPTTGAGIKRQTTVARPTRPPRLPRAPKNVMSPNRGPDVLEGGVASAPRRVIGTSREDVDFNALANYAPPLSTLPPNNPRILKADWRGQVLDLSSDPHRHLLHEAELHLAATLRLSCATYLCSKRRIFMARLEALRIGKEFRKTDSQQACKIDVNKASKLWTAYDRVGWFKPEHFRQYLRA